VTGRRRAALPSRFDLERALHVLRDNLGKADAFITGAEDLAEKLIEQIEQTEGSGEGHQARPFEQEAEPIMQFFTAHVRNGRLRLEEFTDLGTHRETREYHDDKCEQSKRKVR